MDTVILNIDILYDEIARITDENPILTDNNQKIEYVNHFIIRLVKSEELVREFDTFSELLKGCIVFMITTEQISRIKRTISSEFYIRLINSGKKIHNGDRIYLSYKYDSVPIPIEFKKIMKNNYSPPMIFANVLLIIISGISFHLGNTSLAIFSLWTVFYYMMICLCEYYEYKHCMKMGIKDSLNLV